MGVIPQIRNIVFFFNNMYKNMSCNAHGQINKDIRTLIARYENKYTCCIGGS